VAGTLVKSVKLRLTADDGDTEAKLNSISRKADDLGRKHPDIKVKIDTAAASAKLAVLRAELKHTGDAAKDDQGRFLALRDALNVLTVGLSGGWGEMSMFQKVMAGMSLATGLGEPLVAGLTVAVGGLTSGLVAAGAGLGVFGLVAKSVWSGVSSNISAAYAAQQKIAAGATGKNLIADNKALAASLKGLGAGQQSLVLGAANDELSWHKFVTSASSGVASVLVPALGLVPRALQLARGFLGPVESALRNVVAYVSKGLNSQGFGSFIKMLQVNAGPMIEKLAHAIGNIVTGIGGILKAFMPVAQQMGSGLDSITGKFAKWGQTLSSHSGFKSLMSMFKSETPVAVAVLKQLAGIIGTVVKSMAGMSTFSNSKMLLQLALPVLKLVNALLKAHPELVWLVLYLKLAADSGKKLKVAFTGISDALGLLKKGKQAFTDLKAGITDSEAAAQEGATVWTAMGSNISGAVTAVKGWTIWSKIGAAATRVWTGVQAAFDAVMDANPIALVVIGIAALVAAIVILTVKFKAVRDFWKAAWKDIQAVAIGAFHVLEDAVRVYVAMWVAQWNAAKTIVVDVWHLITGFISVQVSVIRSVLSWFGRLPGLFRGWWDDAVSAVVSAVGRLLAFVRGIPGKILSGLASLGSMLFSAGAHAIDSLISGLSSGIGKIGSVMGGIAGKIAGFIGLSPAKEGPLSGGGAPFVRGSHIAADVAAGILSRTPAVGAAMHAMAAAAGIAGAAGSAGSAGGTGWVEARLTWQRTGDTVIDEIGEGLRLWVRHRGGGGPYSAQKAFGQVWPA